MGSGFNLESNWKSYCNIHDRYCMCRLFVVCIYIGATFWKTAKKVRAITCSEYYGHVRSLTTSTTKKGKPGKRKSSYGESPAVDSEYIKVLEDKSNSLEEEVGVLRCSLNSSKAKVTRIVKCFKCVICQREIDDNTSWPLYGSPCCKIVLGCQPCINEMLEKSSRCPNCREDIQSDEFVEIPFIRTLVSALMDC